MRSIILSCTALAALAVTPAMAQMNTGAPGQPGAPPSYSQSQGYGQPGNESFNGQQPAPVGHQPMSTRASNINQQDTRSLVAPSLPSANVGPNADATEYLRAAQRALGRNRTGEAQNALENAETYLLNRSVPQGAVNQPDQSPVVQNINSALQSLAAGDRAQTLNLIQQTIPMAQQFETASAQAGTGMGMQGGSGMAGSGPGMPPPGGGAMPPAYQPGMSGAPAGSGYGQPVPPPPR